MSNLNVIDKFDCLIIIIIITNLPKV